MWPSTDVCLSVLLIAGLTIGHVSTRQNEYTEEYLGCYVDNSDGRRLLPDLKTDIRETLTPDICNKYCFEKGFAFAGTQYSYECFCSKGKPGDDKKVDESECNAKCAGNKTKMCGGDNRLNINKIIIHKKEYITSYIGCYVDNSDGRRLLPDLKTDFPETLTPDICNSHCYEKGFSFGGTQYRTECFCSRSKPQDDKKVDENECNAKCAGDENKLCGGSNRLNIHSIESEKKDYLESYLGCYVDNSDGRRLLPDLKTDFPLTLTPDVCNKYCFEKGFSFAGTQFRYECFCARVKPLDDKKVDESECNAKCAGDETKICGGDNRLNVRSIEAQRKDYTAAYIGCFIDNSDGNRLLPVLKKDFPVTLTPDVCNKYCFDRGYILAGTQFSYECFCAPTRPIDHKRIEEWQCNGVCVGDKTQMCGGINTLNIYSLGSKKKDYTSTYIGCYVDNSDGRRLLPDLKTDFPVSLTPDICDKHCLENGFEFAGTQFSYECFCSKTKPADDKKVDNKECDGKCAGNKNKMCGGFDRLSVRSILPQATEHGSTYLGCYVDNSDGRLLRDLRKEFHGLLTPGLCNSYCFERGFSFAGTEYSYECFCSKTKPAIDKKADEDDCNSNCAGDDKKKCGGYNRLSIHGTGIISIDEDEELKYVGCFRDFSNGTRLMKGYNHDFRNSLTNEICSTLCKNKGFHYAGMEFGRECFCDNRKPSYKYYAKDEDCSKRCDGNYLQICGGNSRLSVFETSVTSVPAPEESDNYIGCFMDQNQGRNPKFFTGHLEHFGKALTPLRCIGLCYSMGFLYAGTQYSVQCLCGDENPSPNLKLADEKCNTPCPGDPAKKCGGSFAVSVHETGISDVAAYENYMGCFNNLNNHVLTDLKTIFEKTNTPQRCLNYCWQLGFKYSGVEYIKQCLCGNQKPKISSIVSGDECNMPCSGDPLETCGASFRLAVYSTDLSISVQPLIKPPDTNTTTTIPTCQLSETTINGRSICKGQVIFADKFDSPLGRKWMNVVKFPEFPDYEFTVFDSNSKNCFVSKNNLIFKPTLFNDTDVQSGVLNLQGCTGNLGTRECGYPAFSFSILPPVASARINTQHFFTFRYGIIEIRAKLPLGDWLVPELWLEPKNHHYGPNYASGRIRIAMSRGNQQLQCDQQDLGTNRVESGIVMGPDNNVKIHSIPSTVPDNWHDHFHTFTLFWKPDSISFTIDNEIQRDIVPQGGRLCDMIGFTSNDCAIWSSGTGLAPFDTEFYISLGLSAGNARDFPDSCINRGKAKPWKNMELKAMLKFWKAKNDWSTTWSDDKSALFIDYVKVTAL